MTFLVPKIGFVGAVIIGILFLTISEITCFSCLKWVKQENRRPKEILSAIMLQIFCIILLIILLVLIINDHTIFA